MGMDCNIIRVSQNKLNDFLENSELLNQMISEQDDYDVEWILDLDKSWEGIQFILTGEGRSATNKVDKLTRALFSEQILDEKQDLGYGPAYYLTAKQVEETNIELNKIDINSLKNSINGKILVQKGIYPVRIWNNEESIEFLINCFNDFKKFYKKATENNEAILSFII